VYDKMAKHRAGNAAFLHLGFTFSNVPVGKLAALGMSTRCIFLASLCFALAVAGCGSDGPTVVPIRGEVLYQDAPLKDVPQGLVRYLPKENSQGRQASGRIQPDGSFVLTTFKGGDGVVPGEYDIVVSAYTTRPELTREQVEATRGVGLEKPRLLIPEKYTEPGTSGLTDTVNSDHSGFKRIELTE
jgi:hypothetical protein